jgi:hypothetical protein
VDVIDARDHLVAYRPDDLEVDGVAVRGRWDRLRGDMETGRRGRLLGIAQGHELAERFGSLERLGGVGLGEKLFPRGGRRKRDVREEL